VTDLPSSSPLARLLAAQQEARKTLYLDLQVPRLPYPVFVRYAPLPQDRIEALTKKFRNVKKDRAVLSDAALLAEACMGVFVHDEDGEPVSIDPDSDVWPKFDDHLADLLGVEATSAADTVRALYLTDGDVISTAVRVVEWSGYSRDDDSGN
jgi:hypothetical protein